MVHHVHEVVFRVIVGGQIRNDATPEGLLHVIFAPEHIEELDKLSLGRHILCVKSVHEPYARHLFEGDGLHEVET